MADSRLGHSTQQCTGCVTATRSRAGERQPQARNTDRVVPLTRVQALAKVGCSEEARIVVTSRDVIGGTGNVLDLDLGGAKGWTHENALYCSIFVHFTNVIP